MFDTEQIPHYLDDIGHRVMKDKSGDEFKVVDLTFRLEPLTAALAAEIASVVKSTLFKLKDAEATEGLKAVTFAVKPKPQQIAFFADRELPKASLRLDEAKISNLRARKPKDGTHWVFTFRATVAQLSGADLLFLQEALYKQYFLTFANASPGLFDSDEKAERKSRGRGTPVSTLASAATH